MADRHHLHRLLAPRHVAVFGGEAAAEAIRQCRRVGFAGEIWPVHPTRTSIEGITCYPDAAALPESPDAAFVAVPNEATVQVVADLAARDTGGVVCHASGFAEDGPGGAALQRDLVHAAGDMALIGPNCIGVLNYLDGAALWADQHGGEPTDRGVAVLTQSGNIGQNLTMQQRSLPLAQLVTIGNGAVTGVADLIDAMLDDPRVTAIGLHLEGIDDVAGLSRAALKALRRRIPIVVLKTGTSELGARANLSHTSSLAGSDTLCDTLFRRLGMARTQHVTTFLETLKFLHVHGALPDTRTASASCSGGEAAHVADLAQQHDVALPAFSPDTTRRLRAVLGESVSVVNPLDYHTYIWGDRDAQTTCFSAYLTADAACHLLLVDPPRADRCAPQHWHTTVDAFRDAQHHSPARTCLVSSLPENLPEHLGQTLLAEGIAPMQGIGDCLAAIAAAGAVGAAQAAVDTLTPPDPHPGPMPSSVRHLDEARGKAELARHGVPTPAGAVVSAEDAPRAATDIGFPVVVKAASSALAHKSDVGGVHISLTDETQVRAAVAHMAALADRFLVERMVDGAVAELLVGVHRDPQFGTAVTIGAGGVLVELVQDTATLLLPATRAELRSAVESLRIWPVLAGYRGGQGCDIDALVDAISGIVDYAHAQAGQLVEMDVNPLLVRADGAVAVDAVIQLGEAETRQPAASEKTAVS